MKRYILQRSAQAFQSYERTTSQKNPTAHNQAMNGPEQVHPLSRPGFGRLFSFEAIATLLI
jgi:hypothetical protein